MKKSIITNDLEHDVLTGEWPVVLHHCIFGNGMRKLADEDGLIIPLTPQHHNCGEYSVPAQIHENVIGERLSKIVGQLAWEKQYYREIVMLHAQEQGAPMEEDDDPARIMFRKRYGLSFL